VKILIKQGRVVDPDSGIDGVGDLLISEDRIEKVGARINVRADKVFDAAGKIVMPGIVDMHVHLREPGREDKETIATGTAAAAAGGVTSVLAMPNTTPAMDSPASILLAKEAIARGAQVRVYLAGALTRERKGKVLCSYTALRRAGAIAFTDDGSAVADAAAMARVMEQAKKSGGLVICHCEDKELSGHGVVNRGIVATRMGLRGISSESEYSCVARDLKLAKKTGARVHIAHVSCRESVALIAEAKKQKVRVTAETAPHYLTFTDTDVLKFDTNMKMNPPLRSAADRAALREGLRSGTIDCLASDHAPHTESEKDIEFDRAEFGIIGLETELSACIGALVDGGVLTWPQLVEKLCVNPSRILGLRAGTLAPGSPADIAIVDPAQEYVLRKEDIVSKSKNSPFIGRKLRGRVCHTFVAGRLVYALPRA
jgi:dihydroorotase